MTDTNPAREGATEVPVEAQLPTPAGAPPSLGGSLAGDHAASTLDDALDRQREGLDVVSRSLWRLALRRFLRHKLAMVSLVVFILIILAGVFAEQLTQYSFSEQNFAEASMPPTLENGHYFGTDQLGRDYFTRVLFGIQTSARVAILVALVSTMIGAGVGAVSGYFGGWTDNMMMRVTDLFLILPFVPVLLVASALLGKGNQYRVALILAFLLWTTLARIVRASFLSLKEKEYVEAAKALGASDPRIILRHMLPNTISPIIVNATLIVAIAILLEATLSFLGFGIQPPTPALGKLISDGKGSMTTMPWLVTFPGLTILLLCLCINFIGDGLRDALDPQQRRVRA